MAQLTIRAKITSDGRIELLEPLPDGFDFNQEITLTVDTIQTVENNEHLDLAAEGIVEPLETPDFAGDQEFIGLWQDRDDIADSGQWVHDLRRRNTRKTPPIWPDQP